MTSLGDVLGDGPVATVYSGLHEGRPVALKVFPKGFGKRVMAAFEKERAALPDVPSILRVAGVETLSGGRQALRMELCAQSLASLVGRVGPLPAADVAVLGQAVASGLGAAHGAGVIHGGISPHNLLFRASGEPVVADFGVTLRHAFPRDPLHVIEFLPPEALRTSVLDVRTDLYGLGAVLHFALTGRSPHPGRLGEPADERVLRVLRTPVPAIARPDVPVALSTVIARLLAIDPVHRPADAMTVAEQLAGMVGVAPAPGPLAAPAPPVPPAFGAAPARIVVPPVPGPPPAFIPVPPVPEAPPADVPVPPVHEAPPAVVSVPPVSEVPPAAVPVPAVPVPPAPAAGPGSDEIDFDDFDVPPDGALPAPAPGEFDDFSRTPAPSPFAAPATGPGFGDGDDFAAPEPPARQLPAQQPPAPLPPLKPAATVFNVEGTRTRRGVRYELLVGAGLVLGLVALVAVYLMPTGAGPGAAPAGQTPSSARDIPTATAVDLELRDPVDRTDQVELAWTSSTTLDFAVVVAADGRETKTLPAHRNLEFTVPVEPGRKYCFLIRGTDGSQLYESTPKSIRGAVCRK
ncbi:serine/threonine-protein kinase [Actinosynnema sp. NPDC051121]